MKIANIDKIKKEEKMITINGRDYVIPGSLPVRLQLQMFSISDRMSTEKMSEKLIDDSLGALLSILKIKNSVEIKEIEDISMEQFVAALNFIIADKSVEETAAIFEQSQTGDVKKNIADESSAN